MSSTSFVLIAITFFGSLGFSGTPVDYQIGGAA